VGDLGNLTADGNGTASYDRVDRAVRLDGPDGVIGRGVIVHAAPDDFTTQPTGAAGARVACGVIGVAK
jgi:Cu-Zn family superoxide dismutase